MTTMSTTESKIVKVGEIYVVKSKMMLYFDSSMKSQMLLQNQKIVIQGILFEFDSPEHGTIGSYYILASRGCGIFIAKKEDIVADLQEYDEWFQEQEQEREMYRKVLEAFKNTENSSPTT